jgi:hypothetical protein
MPDIEPIEIDGQAVVGDCHVRRPNAKAEVPHAKPILDRVGVPRQVGVVGERMLQQTLPRHEEQHLIDAVDIDRKWSTRSDQLHSITHATDESAGVRHAVGPEEAPRAREQLCADVGDPVYRMQEDVLVGKGHDVVSCLRRAVVEGRTG